MSLFWAGIALGILIGNAIRKLYVPITPDGKTEDRIQEEAYFHGYNDGLIQKRGPNPLWFGWRNTND